MKTLTYESPYVEVVDVRVEGGFELSSYAVQGITDYTIVNEEAPMTEVDSY